MNIKSFSLLLTSTVVFLVLFSFLASSPLRLGMLMSFESVFGFPLDEGFETFIVDENQFVCRVEYVVSKVFVVPHFSNEVLCHRLP